LQFFIPIVKLFKTITVVLKLLCILVFDNLTCALNTDNKRIIGSAKLWHGRLWNSEGNRWRVAHERTVLADFIRLSQRVGLPQTMCRHSLQTALCCDRRKSVVVSDKGKGKTSILSGENKEDECKWTTDEVSKCQRWHQKPFCCQMKRKLYQEKIS